MELQEFLTQENQEKIVALQIFEKSAGQLQLSAVVFSHRPKPLETANISLTSNEEGKSFQVVLQLYEFLDNLQLSGLDTFYHQIGSSSVWLLSEELDDINPNSLMNRSVLKKIALFFELHVQPDKKRYVKKSFFKKSPNLLERYERIFANNPEILLNKILQTERTSVLGSLECISMMYGLPEALPNEGEIIVELGYLETYMRLDTPAADAVNLLPKLDQPSVYGSLFGVLNRCKTKMGSKTLERWLRQPLLDLKEITERQNIVELFYQNAIVRNQLRDGPMKNIPDLEAVASKLRKKTAGLAELFRLYLFVKSLPVLLQLLQELSSHASEPDRLQDTLLYRYLNPLTQIVAKFQLYEQLIEHVVDFNALPEYKINCLHDSDLQTLAEEQNGLELRAEKVLQDAKSSYASFAEVRLEKSSQHGLILRTTKGEDERQLREQNSSVRIISILKNGTHFTTPILERIADRYLAIEQEYQEKQQELVDKAVETALTYLPLIESVAVVVSELDVLQAFATASTISPNGTYCRPIIHPRGSGILKLQNARHPCVELMDNVQFISNDYELITSDSNFQIITGPNMGGKSTYIRGVGSIVILAQIGMFVPCDSAEMTVIDCILARVGAGDAVQKGVSTFMAEMLESAVILNTATKDSLIIIDELGRGTSTYDGFGIAWAISDFINREIQCFCLFATHFHEITALAHSHKGIVNKHVSAHIEEGSELVMLYRLQNGPCSESFGVFVAQSAGFPKEVIKEAKRKANALEGKAHDGEEAEAVQTRQEEGRKKMRLMREHLDRFSAINIPAVPSRELKSVLQSLFPPEMTILSS